VSLLEHVGQELLLSPTPLFSCKDKEISFTKTRFLTLNKQQKSLHQTIILTSVYAFLREPRKDRTLMDQ